MYRILYLGVRSTVLRDGSLIACCFNICQRRNQEPQRVLVAWTGTNRGTGKPLMPHGRLIGAAAVPGRPKLVEEPAQLGRRRREAPAADHCFRVGGRASTRPRSRRPYRPRRLPLRYRISPISNGRTTPWRHGTGSNDVQNSPDWYIGITL